MTKLYNFTGFHEFIPEELIGCLKEHERLIILMETLRLSDAQAAEKYINTEQKERLNSYHRFMDRRNYLYSHGIINAIFSALLKEEVKNVAWRYTEYKKPFIENDRNLKFNISHTNGMAAIALGRKEIGVDVEYRDKAFHYMDIVKYSFAKSEKAKINTIDEFYRYWVIKEAYLKQKGVGLYQDLASVEILNIMDHHAEIKDDNQVNQVEMIETEREFALALSYEL